MTTLTINFSCNNVGQVNNTFVDNRQISNNEVPEERNKQSKKELSIVDHGETNEELLQKYLRFMNREKEIDYFHCLDKGFVVVINCVDFSAARNRKNKKFEQLTDREGSDLDVERIKKFFGDKLTWYVETCIGKSILEVAERVSKKDFSDYESLFFFVMSHGCRDGIYNCDGSVVKPDDIMKLFDADNCFSLNKKFNSSGKEVFNEKPKIFIFQACRGTMDDYGQEKSVTDSIAREWSDKTRKTPHMNNFLALYPCVPGYTSLRDEGQGTVFIRALMQLLENCYDQKETIIDICVTRLNYMLANYTDENRKKMTPMAEISLLKKCYFRKYLCRVISMLAEK